MIQFNNVESDELAALVAESNTESHILKTYVDLTDTQILAINATPVLCIAAPASGYAIRILQASGATDGAAAYATNLRLQLYTNQTLPQWQSAANFLDDGSSSTHQLFAPVPATAQNSQIDQAAAVYVWAPVGNPTGGASTVRLYISYEIIEL